MTLALHFLSEVESDALRGYRWYEARSRGLGSDFLSAFYASAGQLRFHPEIYPIVYRDIRRMPLRRFPYSAYYRIADSGILVIGLFHGARDPRSIFEAMKRREDR